jgi:hypothetical protein
MPSSNSRFANKQRRLWEAVVDQVSLHPAEDLGAKVKLVENGLLQGEDLPAALALLNPDWSLERLRRLVPKRLLAKVARLEELNPEELNRLAQAALHLVGLADPANQLRLRPKNSGSNTKPKPASEKPNPISLSTTNLPS